MRWPLLSLLAVSGLSGCSGNACIQDADCPAGDYCDFVATACTGGSGLSTLSGTCRVNCGVCGACTTTDDCGPDQMCAVTLPEGGRSCPTTDPCTGGVCGSDVIPCALIPVPSCPSGCSLVRQPHDICQSFCVCPGNSCF